MIPTLPHRQTRPRGSSQSTIIFLLLTALVAGGGYWLYSTGRLAGLVPAPAPAGPTVQPPAAGGKGTARPTPPRMNPGKGAAADEPGDLAGTIFDMGDGNGVAPNAGRPKPSTGGDGAAAAARLERVAAAQAAVKAARKRLEGHKTEVSKMTQSAAVDAARDEVAAAEAEVKRLRDANLAGSSQMIAASKKSLAAKGKLREALDRVAASDPRVVAAQAELSAAEAELKAARDAAR